MEYESRAQGSSRGSALDSTPEAKCLLGKESFGTVSLQLMFDLETLGGSAYGLGITNSLREYPKGRTMPSSLNFCLQTRCAGKCLSVVRS